MAECYDGFEPKAGLSIGDYVEEIGEWRRSKGFFTPDGSALEAPTPVSLTNADAMLGKLMLVITELAEAAEACRKGDHQNFREEIADAVIRLMDICDSSGIHLGGEIDVKMAINRSRPFKHGKKTVL